MIRVRRSSCTAEACCAAPDTQGTRVIEYLGDRVSHGKRMTATAKAVEDNHTFLFIVIDRPSSMRCNGNDARYINHSCVRTANR